MIFQSADAPELGLLQAARQAGRALVIGTNADQNSVAPGAVPGSAVIDLPLAFLTAERAIRDEAPRRRVFALGTETGVVRSMIHRAARNRVSPPALRYSDCVHTSMTSGNWQSPVPWRISPPTP